MVECHMRKVLWGTSDCLWYEGMEGEGVDEGWRIRGRGSGWKVRRWRVRGYEVVRVGRLPMLKITHNLCSHETLFSSYVPPALAHIFTWLLVAVLP